jgi:predicted metalloendopeptidase
MKLPVSRYYCENNVNPQNKTAVKEMGEILRQTFMNRIARNTWLDAESKAGAQDKLKKMLIQVGWPDHWDESAEVVVKEDDSMNTFDLICDLFKQRTSKMLPALSGKTDADHIFMADIIVVPAWESNAFYSPNNNEVIICASNLMPPIYDPSKDIIYNYAMMGAPTLGHEMTHGFDASGSDYDGTGVYRKWMTPQSRQTFNSLTEQVVKHYDVLTFYRNLHCNGTKTEPENTADMGGLCIAYDALMSQFNCSDLEKLYIAREYFRAFAYGWMEKGTPSYYIAYLIDDHAPASLRVNGTVREMDEFYEAFGIRDGAMYLAPEMRLHIW